MSKVTVAAIQMSCVADAAANLARAEALTREAAAKGAQIVLLPELFERPYLPNRWGRTLPSSAFAKFAVSSNL